MTLPRVVFLSVSPFKKPRSIDEKPFLSSLSEEIVPAGPSDLSGDNDEDIGSGIAADVCGDVSDGSHGSVGRN